MKLKRMSAFLIMVFILSGCVSDVSLNGTIENNNQAAKTVQKTQLSYQGATYIAAANKQLSLSMNQEVQSYARTKASKKLIQQTSAQNALKAFAEISQADQYEPPKPEVIEDVTQASANTSFYVKTTLYGVDCYGCNVNVEGTGNTATGVSLNPSLGVKQSSGAWLSGLTYDGYYIIATDRSIPFYSIIEISNHGLSGMGFSPDQPIQCIVLDRGGGIRGNHVDLYIGSEANVGNISYNGSQAVATILRYGR